MSNRVFDVTSDVTSTYVWLHNRLRLSVSTTLRCSHSMFSVRVQKPFSTRRGLPLHATDLTKSTPTVPRVELGTTGNPLLLPSNPEHFRSPRE